MNRSVVQVGNEERLKQAWENVHRVSAGEYPGTLVAIIGVQVTTGECRGKVSDELGAAALRMSGKLFFHSRCLFAGLRNDFFQVHSHGPGDPKQCIQAWALNFLFHIADRLPRQSSLCGQGIE